MGFNQYGDWNDVPRGNLALTFPTILFDPCSMVCRFTCANDTPPSSFASFSTWNLRPSELELVVAMKRLIVDPQGMELGEALSSCHSELILVSLRVCYRCVSSCSIYLTCLNIFIYSTRSNTLFYQYPGHKISRTCRIWHLISSVLSDILFLCITAVPTYKQGWRASDECRVPAWDGWVNRAWRVHIYSFA